MSQSHNAEYVEQHNTRDAIAPNSIGAANSPAGLNEAVIKAAG